MCRFLLSTLMEARHFRRRLSQQTPVCPLVLCEYSAAFLRFSWFETGRRFASLLSVRQPFSDVFG